MPVIEIRECVDYPTFLSAITKAGNEKGWIFEEKDKIRPNYNLKPFNKIGEIAYTDISFRKKLPKVTIRVFDKKSIDRYHAFPWFVSEENFIDFSSRIDRYL